VAKFVVELGGQGFVGRQDQRRAIDRGDDVGHGKGFAGTGDAQQHLAFCTIEDLFGDGVDGLGPGRRKGVNSDTSLKDDM
jgi:hypothetical protein